ncbi:MAG: hypothetical protein KJ927_17745, partial [Candidatus Eisenbacteria bacterium]|nr:hypothetical protein [Candidatus Eisenbacteria bacterium]
MPDDDYLIRFKLYDVATGGSYLWQETQTVTTADGLFDVILGEVNSIGLPFDETYWLELQVGGDLVMEPRVQLTAVPYAIRALNADTAEDEDWVIDGDDIYPIDGQVAVGTTPPAKSEGEEEKGDRSESEAKLNVQGNETALYAQLEASDNTAMDRAGVYGVRHRITSNPGIGFAHGENNNAVLGLNTYGDTYTFGVAGYATLDSPWTAGVLGSTADGSTWGALGYRGGNTQPWGVYT